MLLNAIEVTSLLIEDGRIIDIGELISFDRAADEIVCCLGLLAIHLKP